MPAFDKPFFHMVIDDWAQPELLWAADAEWPAPTWPHWHRYENGKLATKDTLRFPPACGELIRRLLSLPIEELTGIGDTFADWNCHGAGLHMLPPDCQLDVHLDSDHHPLFNWQRGVNAILFVNRSWDRSWGGELELYDATGRQCLKRIEPQFNRLVLFAPSDISYHAVAQVASAAEVRKTLAVFYWQHSANTGKRERAQFIAAGADNGCA